jgi:hypothetical protein
MEGEETVRQSPDTQVLHQEERIEEDPKGDFYNTLADHYGNPVHYPGDPRVIFYVKLHHIVGLNLDTIPSCG